MKIYLTVAVCILMFITSLGIYGFLVSSYQKTAYKMENVDKLVETLNIKRNRYQEQLTDVRKEKDQITATIKELNSKQGTQNQYTDKNGNIIRYTDRRTANSINEEVKANAVIRDGLYEKETVINDSITALDLRILDLQTNSDVAAEVGPLKYISEITGKPMDIVVNWFILLFIIVFDPLAVILLIAANRILVKNKKQQKIKNENEGLFDKVEHEKEENIQETVTQPEPVKPEPKPESKHLSQAWRTQSRKK